LGKWNKSYGEVKHKMDVLTKRNLMKKLEEGTFTQEELDSVLKNHQSGQYGDTEYIAKEKSKGTRIETSFRDEIRAYWVPEEGTQLSARGIRIQKAYRIFNEAEGRMELREVEEPSERDAIVRGYEKEFIKSFRDKIL
jgi:hypothetical protein